MTMVSMEVPMGPYIQPLNHAGIFFIDIGQFLRPVGEEDKIGRT